MLFLIFIFFIHLSFANFDVQVIDHLIEHHRQTIALGELAQEKSQNLALKRLARKIMRDERKKLKKLNEWRSAYYDGVPEAWIEDLKRESIQTSGAEFDSAFLTRMLENHDYGIELLKRADRKASRPFLKEFAQREVKDLLNEKEELEKLKKKLE